MKIEQMLDMAMGSHGVKARRAPSSFCMQATCGKYDIVCYEKDVNLECIDGGYGYAATRSTCPLGF